MEWIPLFFVAQTMMQGIKEYRGMRSLHDDRVYGTDVLVAEVGIPRPKDDGFCEAIGPCKGGKCHSIKPRHVEVCYDTIKTLGDEPGEPFGWGKAGGYGVAIRGKAGGQHLKEVGRIIDTQ